MGLTRQFTVGGLRCHTLEGGPLWLDGGAMFGIVPKPLWEKRAAPDARNRIPMAMRCLLIEHPEGLVLVDTGAGNKDDAKFRDIYGIDNRGVRGATQLEDALAEAGFAPDEVRWIVNTHLHFDHAGGNTRRTEDGGVELAFPNATYVVQRGELDFALHPNERTRGSYLAANFELVGEARRWHLVEGEAEILPGILARPTPGHVPYHQSIVLRDGGETAVFLADLVPTAAHLPLPWIMGYDLEPLRTLESRRALYEEALAGEWLLIFEHDAGIATGRLQQVGKGFELRDTVPAGGVAVG